jgi:hypothetical protein
MPLLQPTGTITYPIFTGQTVGSSNPTFNLDFSSQKINWSGTVPLSLSGITLRDLLKNPLFKISYKVNIQITGNQYFDGGSQPTTSANITYSNIIYPVTYEAGCTDVSYGTCYYNVNQTFSFPGIPRYIDISVFNQCKSPGCIWYNAYNYIFIFTLIIEVSADCTGKNLDQDFCSNYCSTNADSCLSDFVSYCLPKTGDPTKMPIGTSIACQTFINNYIGNIGTKQEFDDGLLRYCDKSAGGKFRGFEDLFNGNASDIDQKLCACHMDDKQYKAFATELSKNYSGFENIFIDQCLVPGCINSPFKSRVTTQVCPLPKCLNIVNFTNDGTFDNSNVNIVQNSDCANIKPISNPNPPNPHNLTWLWILIGIIAFMIILIVVIAIIFSYRKHQKANLKMTSKTIN